MQNHGVQIYPGNGKHPCDRAEDDYPPRSHDCMPEETEFAETHQEAQVDLERREKNRNQSNYHDVEECSRPHLANASY